MCDCRGWRLLERQLAPGVALAHSLTAGVHNKREEDKKAAWAAVQKGSPPHGRPGQTRLAPRSDALETCIPVLFTYAIPTGEAQQIERAVYVRAAEWRRLATVQHAR